MSSALAAGVVLASRWRELPQSGLWFHAQRAWVILTMLTIGLALVRRLGPRPVLPPGRYGAGDAACLGVVVAVGFMLAARVPSMLVYHVQNGAFRLESLRLLFDDRRPAIAVVSCWAILRLTRGWYSVRDWVDRVGMAAGWAWVAMALVVPFANTLISGR
jgi:hypothetical protein